MRDASANISESRHRRLGKKNLDRLEQWHEMNVMEFKRKKCEILHLDRKNEKQKYKMKKKIDLVIVHGKRMKKS